MADRSDRDPPERPAGWTPSGLVTLLTDFGLRDPYVGIMKGVLFRGAPGLRAVIDLTHDVPAQDVDAAAFYLAHSWSWFPRGTVHVAVVDPEVGTARGILLAECDGHAVLAPDNGLIGPLLERAEETVVRRVDLGRIGLEGGSRTFHGRDRFAPAAAMLVTGLCPDEMGKVASPARLALDRPERAEDGTIEARVLLADRFGNLITDVPGELLVGVAGGWIAEYPGGEARVVATYAEAAPGETVALVDSFGRIELAVRDGDAALEHSLGRGARIRLRPAGPPAGGWRGDGR